MIESELEKKVQHALQYALEQYDSLHTMADQMLSNQQTPEQWHQTAEKMRGVSVAIERVEQESQSTKEQYRASCVSPSNAVSQLSAKLATHMQSFLMKVSRLEQQASKSKDALLPQIHDGVKAVQMKNAYGRYS